MAARILDGSGVAGQIRAETAPAIASFASRVGRPPCIVIVLVGNDPASEIYVRNKLKSAGDAAVRAELERLPATAQLSEVLSLVERLNRSDECDAILVQSPLPDAMGADAERAVFDAIDPAKDVDGLHPLNVGKLVQNRASLAACTPSGIIELLERSGIGIAGARAVVIGRSDIVGKPMALLLIHRHATVTVCHSRTVDLARVASEADIVVSAIGRPAFVTKDFIKPGATVVDVGTSQVSDRATVERLFPAGSKRREAYERRGALVVGDVHPGVAEVAGAVSPVPGGVGPLTIAMLLKNTATAALQRAERAGRKT
jgi:methylenetetrahydrofolate dehydrogenase (NADP+)/methenyltetrahydrofolate cyclohydrolase